MRNDVPQVEIYPCRQPGTRPVEVGIRPLGRVITITPQGVTPRVLVVSAGERIVVRNLDAVPHQIFSAPTSIVRPARR
jgi:hypothetical protein